MLDTFALNEPLASVAILTVLIGITARIYFGRQLFHPQWTVVWGNIRRVGVPLLNVVLGQVVRRVTGYSSDPALENNALAGEYVGTVSGYNMRSLAMEINSVRDVEVPLLAGYKTDWKGREEVGTLVEYHGPKPFGGAPPWLRDRQLHMTFFEDDDGHIIATAHEEANSYRPDQWVEHLFRHSQNAEKGVRMTANIFDDLDVRLE